jgi:hypothetical protein
VEDLVLKIVEMSSGVFLWVALIIKSLLQGLTNFDSVSDLIKRLLELLIELNDLFNRIIESISPVFYVKQAARLF